MSAEPSGDATEDDMARQASPGRRLVVVSNRVPTPGSPGGLATGLASAINDRESVWFGWSGKILGPEEASQLKEVKQTRVGTVTYATIPMMKNAFAGYYLGFSNSYLWPLMHSLVDKIEYHHGDLRAYKKINKIFAETLEKLVRGDDIIWIHDYHLIPLGALLKKELKRKSFLLKMGFFLHIPFPAPSVFTSSATCDSSNLPNAHDLNALVQDFAAYDLIGVHTDQDAVHLNTVLAERGFRATARPFPIAIDPVEFLQQSLDNEKAARDWVDSNIPQYEGCTPEQKKLVIGVDRLDYTKGIPERLRGFELMLRRHPEMRKNFAFVQISAVSRADVRKYQLLTEQVSALVETISSGFNDRAPVYWHRTAVPRNIVAGLCRLAQVALITPLADGMNLVAKEFVAAQVDANPGVLVLSRYAGAAPELEGTKEKPGALIVDPYNANDIAESLFKALTMEREERQARIDFMNDNVQTSTAATWSQGFVKALLESETFLEETEVELLFPEESIEDVVEDVEEPETPGHGEHSAEYWDWYFSSETWHEDFQDDVNARRRKSI